MKSCWAFAALLFVAACGGNGNEAASGSGSGGDITGASSSRSAAESATTTGAGTGGFGGGSGGSGGGPLCDVIVPADDPLAVGTTYGAIRGTPDDDTTAFLGIPYAAPPVGDLRFRAPAVPACWDGVLDTIDYGNSCVQDA